MVEDNYEVSAGDELNAAVGGMVEQMVAERHALFDDVEKTTRDDDELPMDRGASGRNLRWHPVLGDEKLDRNIRERVWKMAKKHPHALLEPEDVIQRVRLKIERAREKYPLLPILDWQKLTNHIITNELARYAKRMERESQERHAWISRDSHDEVDADGEETNWRENLDSGACSDEFLRDRRKIDVEEALARMSPTNRELLRLHFWGNLGLRAIAKTRGSAYSTFHDREWKEALTEFRKIFSDFSDHPSTGRGFPDGAGSRVTCPGVIDGKFRRDNP